MALPSEDEILRWSAFHNLLTWAEAVVKQRKRLDAAIRKMLAKEPALNSSQWRRLVRLRGRPLRAFNAERHLFINSAHQLMQYRKWVGRLGILSNDFFRGIDKFDRAVNILRDKNEHAIEYRSGKGKKPAEWVYANAAAIAVVGKVLGGRLDYVAFTEAVEGLLKLLHQEELKLFSGEGRRPRKNV
jgi:hypothetical protein